MSKKIFFAALSMMMLVFALSMGMKGTAKAEFKYCSETTSVKYDLDGNGKEEVIQFKFNPTDSPEWFNISISINGKTKIAKLKEKNWDDYLSVSYDFIKLKNGKRFLYVNPTEYNSDGPSYLYQYKAGKLKKVCTLDKYCRWIGSIDVQGNSIKVKMSDSGGKIGSNRFWSKYTFKKNKFVLNSKTHKMAEYMLYNSNMCEWGIIPLKVLRPFTVYADKKCKKSKGTAVEGDHVKVTKVYKDGKNINYYIVGDSIKGWITGDVDYENPTLENEGTGVA